ncbi:MAG TPA: tryptophan synthase subunit alpha, partial [Firmicutes bacterium]|nr:tryptophan synthase subunit alpha [Bacillota bacterium]
ATLSDRLAPLIERGRRHTDLPLAAGFGISGPDQAREASRIADAVIMGSALIDQVSKARDARAASARAGEVVAELKRAVSRP